MLSLNRARLERFTRMKVIVAKALYSCIVTHVSLNGKGTKSKNGASHYVVCWVLLLEVGGNPDVNLFVNTPRELKGDMM